METVQEWVRRRADLVVIVLMAFLALGGSALALHASPLWALAGLGGVLALCAVWWGWPRSGLLALLIAGMFSRYDAEVLGRTVKVEHLAVLLVLGLLVSQVFLGKRKVVVTWAGAFAIAWVLWNAGATALAPLVNPAAPNHLLKLALMVGAYLCVVNLVRDEGTLRWTFWTWLVVGTLEAAWGIVAWAAYVLARVNLGIQMTANLPVPVPYGTLLEGNIYCSHSMSLAVAYVTLVLTRPGKRLFGPRLRWTDVGLAVTLVAVVLGMSRGAWLGLAAALLTALLITRRLAHRLSRRLVLAVSALLVLLALLGLFVELAPRGIPLVDRLASFTRLEQEVTVAGRLAKYQAALSSWLERPVVGWGTGSMAVLYAERGRRWAWVSNLALHLLLDTGIIGLALFCGFVAALLWRAAGAARAAGPTFRRRVLLALIAGFVGLLVAYQSTEATWLVLPWIHAGLLAAAARLPLTGEGHHEGHEGGPHSAPTPSLSTAEGEGGAGTDDLSPSAHLPTPLRAGEGKGLEGRGEVAARHAADESPNPGPTTGPDFSVIVVNWNTRDLLRACLASVVAQMEEVALELLVVDNASTDGSAEMVQREFPQARLWVNEENRGFAAANNQAMAQAQGRYLFLLNSDASLRPGALRALRDFLDAHPEAVVAGPRVLNPDRTVQPSCFRFPTAWDVFCEMAFLSALFPASPLFNRRGMGGFDRRTVREVDWVLGAAMAVRRERAEQVGGLDEGYFIYAEELDWCRRIREAGGGIFFFPGAEVVHYGGVSKARAREAILPRAFASRFRYYERFHGRGYTRLVRALTLAGILPRMAVAALLGYVGGQPAWREACRAYWGVLRVAWRGRWTPSGR